MESEETEETAPPMRCEAGRVYHPKGNPDAPRICLASDHRRSLFYSIDGGLHEVAHGRLSEGLIERTSLEDRIGELISRIEALESRLQGKKR